MPSPEDDRKLVVSFMHHSGARSTELDPDTFQAVYREADGFGHLGDEELAAINDGYDWSHVRDSSSEGWARMAAVIREKVLDAQGPVPGPGGP